MYSTYLADGPVHFLRRRVTDSTDDPDASLSWNILLADRSFPPLYRHTTRRPISSRHSIHSSLRPTRIWRLLSLTIGSTDGTVQRVEAMARNHSQIRIIRQANLGVAAARNCAIEESRGEFIAPVDADDIWFPEAVTKLVNCFLSSDSRTGVAYGWPVIIDENGLVDGRFRCSTIEGNVLGTLICHNFLGNASATMIRRACFVMAASERKSCNTMICIHCLSDRNV